MQKSPHEDIIPEVVQRMEDGWGRCRIAEHFGLSKGAAQRLISRIQRDRLNGVSVPLGMVFTKTTVHTRTSEDGSVIVEEWPRFEQDKEQATFLEWAEPLIKSAKAIRPPVVKVKNPVEGLLAHWVFGDPHFGMLAWREETGEDWDTKTSYNVTATAADMLADYSKEKKVAKILITFLGDNCHYDSFKAQTPQSGHPLDTDTRAPKMISMARDAMVYSIEQAASIAPTEVEVVSGNHDPILSLCIRMMLQERYRDCPDITISEPTKGYHVTTWGDVLLASLHGDRISAQRLASCIPNEFRKEWGATRFTYVSNGHVHHRKEGRLEPRGDESEATVVRYFPTLAAKDFYAASHGYDSQRTCSAFLIDREYGQVGEEVVHVRRIFDAMENEHGPS